MPLIAQAVVEVADVKAYCKIPGTTDDAIIEKIINGVSLLFEKYCAAKFINQTITEIIDGSGEDKLIVEFIPIVSLTEIKFYVDDVPETQTLTDFDFKSGAGIIRYKFGIFSEGFQNISVKYSCGYGATIANLPEDLRLAALKQCEFFYKRDSADFSLTFREGMILQAPSQLLSPSVRDMLTPYMRVRM